MEWNCAIRRYAAGGLLLAVLGGASSPAWGASDAATQPAGAATSQPETQATSQPATQPAAPASSTWPPGLLMEGLAAGGLRKPLDDAGVRVWGFTEGGFTGYETGGQSQLYGRYFDGRRPNNANLNQLRLTADRPYDPTKPFDWGFRIDGLYGGDAMLTHSRGLFPYSGSGDGSNWADLLQAYAQLWFKTGDASGLEITAGKLATTLGYEVIDATGNALYSHSFLFNYAVPLTHTGVKANYIFNSQASAYVAVVEGCDVFEDNNHAVSWMAGGALSGSEQIDGHARTQYYLNVMTGPEQDDDVNNYRTVVDQTLTHWWTSNLSQSINGDYGTEENVPGVGRANWYGVANYFTYVWSDKVSSTWRTEWFRDEKGVRIGAPGGNFVENTLGLNLTPWPNDKVFKNLSFRPEVRWDQGDNDAFGGGRKYQITTAFDVIFKF